MLYLIKKFIILGRRFLNNDFDAEDFKCLFYDLYFLEIKKFQPKNKEEENMEYLFADIYEQISYYSPFRPATQEEKKNYLLIDEEELQDYTRKMVNRLEKYMDEHGKDITLSVPENIGAKFQEQMEYLILCINRCFGWRKNRLEEDELIKVIAEIEAELKPNTEVEREIKKHIGKYLKLLKRQFKHQERLDWFQRALPRLYILFFPPPEDPLSVRNKFTDIAGELNRKLYFYLNPVL